MMCIKDFIKVLSFIFKLLSPFLQIKKKTVNKFIRVNISLFACKYFVYTERIMSLFSRLLLVLLSI